MSYGKKKFPHTTYDSLIDINWWTYLNIEWRVSSYRSYVVHWNAGMTKKKKKFRMFSQKLLLSFCISRDARILWLFEKIVPVQSGSWWYEKFHDWIDKNHFFSSLSKNDTEKNVYVFTNMMMMMMSLSYPYHIPDFMRAWSRYVCNDDMNSWLAQYIG